MIQPSYVRASDRVFVDNLDTTTSDVPDRVYENETDDDEDDNSNAAKDLRMVSFSFHHFFLRVQCYKQFVFFLKQTQKPIIVDDFEADLAKEAKKYDAAVVSPKATPVTVNTTAEMRDGRGGGPPAKRKLVYLDDTSKPWVEVSKSFIFDASHWRGIKNAGVVGALEKLYQGDMGLFPSFKIGSSLNMIAAQLNHESAESSFVLSPQNEYGGLGELGKKAIVLTATGLHNLKAHTPAILKYLKEMEKYRLKEIEKMPYCPNRHIIQNLPNGQVLYVSTWPYSNDDTAGVGVLQGERNPQLNKDYEKNLPLNEDGTKGQRPGVCLRGENFLMLMEVYIPIIANVAREMRKLRVNVASACGVESWELQDILDKKKVDWIAEDPDTALYEK
jgi:hypothetical protein